MQRKLELSRLVGVDDIQFHTSEKEDYRKISTLSLGGIANLDYKCEGDGEIGHDILVKESPIRLFSVDGLRSCHRIAMAKVKESPLAEFLKSEVPDWTDEVVTRARYKGFTGQRGDWESRLHFWRDLVVKCARYLNVVVIDPHMVQSPTDQ